MAARAVCFVGTVDVHVAPAEQPSAATRVPAARVTANVSRTATMLALPDQACLLVNCMARVAEAAADEIYLPHRHVRFNHGQLFLNEWRVVL